MGTVLDHIQDGLFLRFVERMPVPQGSIRSVAEDVRRIQPGISSSEHEKPDRDLSGVVVDGKKVQSKVKRGLMLFGYSIPWALFLCPCPKDFFIG